MPGQEFANIVSLLALVVAALAAFFAYRGPRSDQRSYTTATIVDTIAKRLRDVDHLTAEEDIAKLSPELDSDKLLAELQDNPSKTTFEQVGIFYESLGALAFFDQNSTDLVVALLESRIRRNWRRMRPIVRNERAREEGPKNYLKFFENLYVEACKPSSIREEQTKRLKSDPEIAPSDHSPEEANSALPDLATE